MQRYAAFIRGIMPSNPKMVGAKLRGVFEGLGFADVGSVLASGNLFFGSDETDPTALEAQIEAGLQGELGIPGRTIIRSLPQLQTLIDSDPFPGLTHQRGTYLTATFLKGFDAPASLSGSADGLTRIVGYDADARAVLAITDNSIPGTTPDFMILLENATGADITTRTWLTVQRVLKKLHELDGAPS